MLNQANKRKHRGSLLKGVSKRTDRSRRPFVSQIRARGKLHFLGCYATEEEAHGAYLKAAQEMFGEFARSA